MKLDYKLKDILTEIQTEVKKEQDVDISIQELAAISNSQFDVAVYGMTKGFNITLHRLGTIKRRFLIEIHAERKRMQKFKKTHTKEEFEIELAKVKKSYKERRKEMNKLTPAPTLEELFEAKSTVNTNTKFAKYNV